MRIFATRVLASTLAGLLSTSCATVESVERRKPPEPVERIFLPRAPRAFASPVVEQAELRRAIEDFLPSVNVEAAQADLHGLGEPAELRFPDATFAD